MANQKDLYYRPDIKAPVKEADIVGVTADEVNAALANLNAAIAANPDLGDPKIYQSINELADAALVSDADAIKHSTVIDALIDNFAKHEENARIIRDRLKFLISLMIKDLNGDMSDAPPVVKQYIQDLTGIDVNNPDTSTLDPETITCILSAAGVMDPSKNAKSIDLNDDKNSALAKVESVLGGISTLNIMQFGLMLLIIVLKLCYVIMVHYTVGFMCGFFKDKLIIGFRIKISKWKRSFQIKLGKKIAKCLRSIERRLLGFKFIGYKCSKNGQVPLCTANSDPSNVKINVVTCCTMEPIFFNSDQTNPSSGKFTVNSCFKSWIESQLNPDTAGVRGTICGGSCKPIVAGYAAPDQNKKNSSTPAPEAKTETDPLSSIFAGMTIDQIKDTLDTLSDQYDQITEAMAALTAEYNAKANTPDPVLPPLSSLELAKLHITEAKRQADYAASCAAKRAKWKSDYDAAYAAYNNQITETEDGKGATIADKISYANDLIFSSEDSPVDSSEYEDDDDDDASAMPPNPKVCEPTPTEQAKAAVIADYLVTNGTSKSGVTDPANIAMCSQGIAKTDAAISMSQQVQSSLNSAKTHTYTGTPNGLGDCFGYSDDSNYAKYRSMSKKDRENAITADLTKAISNRAAELDSENTDSGTAIMSNSIYGYNGANDFTDIIGIADRTVSSLVDTADGIVTKVAGYSRWLSSKQLCCVIYILVFIISIARVFAKGSEYTLCRKKCKKCGGSGKVIDGNGNSVTCPECNGTGYGKDLMDSAEWVRNFMHVQWAKSAAKDSNIQTLISMLTIIKQIIDIFARKNKRSLLLSGLTIPLNEMFELIKVTIAAALTEFLDAILGPLDMAMTSALGIPEIRNMMNNECPILPPIIKWLQCMLNGMKFGIVTSFMKLFDANVQDVVIISDMLLCRQRMAFLDSLSKLLGDLIKLIAGLKDCYDPGALVDYVLEEVKQDQYTKHTQLLSILGTKEGVDMFNACVNGSLTGNKVTFSEKEIEEIESKPGTNNTGLGSELSAIIDQYNREQDTSDLKVTYVSGKLTATQSATQSQDPLVVIPTYSDFKKELEDVTGVTMTAMRESMNEIYTILSGDPTHKSSSI